MSAPDKILAVYENARLGMEGHIELVRSSWRNVMLWIPKRYTRFEIARQRAYFRNPQRLPGESYILDNGHRLAAPLLPCKRCVCSYSVWMPLRMVGHHRDKATGELLISPPWGSESPCPLCCESPMTVDVLARYVEQPWQLNSDAEEAILVLADHLMQRGRPTGAEIWAERLKVCSALGALPSSLQRCVGCVDPGCAACAQERREDREHGLEIWRDDPSRED